MCCLCNKHTPWLETSRRKLPSVVRTAGGRCFLRRYLDFSLSIHKPRVMQWSFHLVFKACWWSYFTPRDVLPKTWLSFYNLNWRRFVYSSWRKTETLVPRDLFEHALTANLKYDKAILRPEAVCPAIWRFQTPQRFIYDSNQILYSSYRDIFIRALLVCLPLTPHHSLAFSSMFVYINVVLLPYTDGIIIMLL